MKNISGPSNRAIDHDRGTESLLESRIPISLLMQNLSRADVWNFYFDATLRLTRNRYARAEGKPDRFALIVS